MICSFITTAGQASVQTTSVTGTPSGVQIVAAIAPAMPPRIDVR
jgi:hypothetical protein